MSSSAQNSSGSASGRLPRAGERVALMTSSLCRYEGDFGSVNRVNSTFTLANVKAFGTEDRVAAPNIVLGSDAIYDIVEFSVANVRDLVLLNNLKSGGGASGGRFSDRSVRHESRSVEREIPEEDEATEHSLAYHYHYQKQQHQQQPHQSKKEHASAPQGYHHGGQHYQHQYNRQSNYRFSDNHGFMGYQEPQRSGGGGGGRYAPQSYRSYQSGPPPQHYRGGSGGGRPYMGGYGGGRGGMAGGRRFLNDGAPRFYQEQQQKRGGGDFHDFRGDGGYQYHQRQPMHQHQRQPHFYREHQQPQRGGAPMSGGGRRFSGSGGATLGGGMPWMNRQPSEGVFPQCHPGTRNDFLAEFDFEKATEEFMRLKIHDKEHPKDDHNDGGAADDDKEKKEANENNKDKEAEDDSDKTTSAIDLTKIAPGYDKEKSFFDNLQIDHGMGSGGHHETGHTTAGAGSGGNNRQAIYKGLVETFGEETVSALYRKNDFVGGQQRQLRFQKMGGGGGFYHQQQQQRGGGGANYRFNNNASGGRTFVPTRNGGGYNGGYQNNYQQPQQRYQQANNYYGNERPRGAYFNKMFRPDAGHKAVYEQRRRSFY